MSLGSNCSTLMHRPVSLGSKCSAMEVPYRRVYTQNVVPLEAQTGMFRLK